MVGGVKWAVLFLAFLCAAPLRAEPIVGSDVDGKQVVLNAEGRVSVVMSSTPDTDVETRDAGQVLDSFRGRRDFQFFVVVDLRNSIAGVMPPLVRQQVRQNLDAEAKRLKPFYLANGNQSDPRLSEEVFPDFKGTLCRPLGWAPAPEKLRAVVYGFDGKEVARWDELTDYAALRKAVEKVLAAPQSAQN